MSRASCQTSDWIGEQQMSHYSDEDIPDYDSPSTSGEEEVHEITVDKRECDETISKPKTDAKPTATSDDNATADAATTTTTAIATKPTKEQKVSNPVNRSTKSYSDVDSYSDSSSDSESDEGYAHRKRGQLKKVFRREKRSLFDLKRKLVDTERLLTQEVYHWFDD